MNVKRQTITSRSGKAGKALPVRMSLDDLKRSLDQLGEPYPEKATLADLQRIHQSKFQEN